MNKRTYTTPVVEISRWVSEDVITTSGTAGVALSTATPEIGQSGNVISLSDIPEV